MKPISYIYTFLCILSIMYSCKKKEKDSPLAPDTSAPQLTFTQPVPYSSHHFEDTVFIKGTVSDNAGLKHVGVHVKNMEKDSTFFHFHTVPNTNKVEIDTFYIVSETESAHHLIMIDADDVSGNHSDLDIKISLNHHH